MCRHSFPFFLILKYVLLISNYTISILGASGGALVSLIHDYTANGDPFIRQFTKHLLEQVSRPFFQCLSKWIYEGELLDENEDEFFVQLSASPELRNSQYGGTTGKNRLAKSGRGLGSEFAIGGLEGENRQPETYKLWAEKFSFRVDMLPKFLDETYGKKVGRHINHISIILIINDTFLYIDIFNW